MHQYLDKGIVFVAVIRLKILSIIFWCSLRLKILGLLKGFIASAICRPLTKMKYSTSKLSHLPNPVLICVYLLIYQYDCVVLFGVLLLKIYQFQIFFKIDVNNYMCINIHC